MTLETYQRTLELGKLYRIKKVGGVSGSEQLIPNIWMNAGSVDIHCSNSATQPTSLSQMTLNETETGVAGSAGFKIIAKYIAIVQNTDTTAEITVSGLDVEDLGSIS